MFGKCVRVVCFVDVLFLEGWKVELMLWRVGGFDDNVSFACDDAQGDLHLGHPCQDAPL